MAQIKVTYGDRNFTGSLKHCLSRCNGNGPWDKEKEFRFPVTIASPVITDCVFKELESFRNKRETRNE